MNKSVQDFVVSHCGEPAWERICARAGVEDDVFVTDQTYPDEITYQLLGAAGTELGEPPETILREFGRQWVSRAAQSGYGVILDSAGRTLREFLMNLPSLHARVQMTMPALRPPRFEYTDVEEDSLHLHYHADRPGLSSFLCGVLDGLGQRFSTPVEIRQLARKADGAPHDILHVRWTAPVPETAEPAPV